MTEPTPEDDPVVLMRRSEVDAPRVGLTPEQRAVVDRFRDAVRYDGNHVSVRLAASALAIIDALCPPAAVDREER